jgi:hypothetical protein
MRLLRARPDPSAGIRAPRWYRAAHGPACGVLPVEGGHDARTGGRGGRRAAEPPGLIPEIRSFECGPDLGVNAGNWDFAVVAAFDSTSRPSIATIRSTSR